MILLQKHLINYSIADRNRKTVPVVKKHLTIPPPFRCYMGWNKKTANNCKTFLQKCGSSDQTAGEKEITISIMGYISQYKGCVSHYGRGKNIRVYLLAEQNFKKLLKNWKLHKIQNMDCSQK